MKRRRQRITERENPAAANLERKSTFAILEIINREDRKVALAVRKAIPEIARAVNLAAEALAQGGRLIYLGTGTSGRLGVLDAAECLPTFSTDRVQAVMAGAPKSMFRPAEASEDDTQLAVRDLRRKRLSRKDVLVGISASGVTPYTLGGMRYAHKVGAKTIALTSNPAAPIRKLAEVAIVPVVGAEIIAGSSRMKAGTAQKLVLNMISTATMARLGRVVSGRMIALRINNRKLRERGRRILMRAGGLSAHQASAALGRAGWNIPVALLMLRRKLLKAEAQRLFEDGLDAVSLLKLASGGHAPTTKQR
jgi:N-acetylmuramic acid 6-phosphate etherase